ncbi:ArsB/NhaD family transporter [Candidatus Gracilibacteria bacterium 28_42_T64]|nr:ArsB/NhaD family transporter [Candidatus Gracilibacteria bacterium 28_42_T64]
MEVGTGALIVSEVVAHTTGGTGFWLSIVIFVITFGIILSERIHRSVIGLIGALVMVIAGMFFGFYSPEGAKAAIDFNTIGLLFGMMVIVAILEQTGAFQYLGIKVAKKTGGNLWKLTVALGTLTTLLSLILDNVTTIILIVPITIIICKILRLNPTPILMAEALLSDTGGVATLVGDPPNIMIGSVAGFSFTDFLVHSMPIVFVAWFLTLFTLKIVFKKELQEKPDPKAIEDLMKMKEEEAITDPETLKKILVVLGIVVILFFVHHIIHISPSMVAIIGASLALILVSATKDPQKILEKLELSVLLFFGALFVIVGGLEHAGVLKALAELITAGAADNILVTALIVLWVSAVLSALVDNIPMTVAMLPIIAYLQYEVQLPGVELLWWALVFGVGFGGNASPIGSTANIIVVSKSEQTDNPITFRGWMKSGLSTAFVSLVTATGGLYILSLFIVK